MNIEAYRTLKPHHNTVDKMIVTNPLTKNIAQATPKSKKH